MQNVKCDQGVAEQTSKKPGIRLIRNGGNLRSAFMRGHLEIYEQYIFPVQRCGSSLRPKRVSTKCQLRPIGLFLVAASSSGAGDLNALKHEAKRYLAAMDAALGPSRELSRV